MIDPDAMHVLKTLGEAGFSGYLVGGGVRDLYLGKRPKDFDISTNARPGQIRKLFPHSNTIGRRFRLVQVFFRGGKTIEVSTLRSLSEHDIDGPETVLAPNNTFGTLSEDARRRDLTINSLFFEIENSTIIDYVDGTRDLDKGIIRIVGEPEVRIRRDPVRMMRAIRHAARNGFKIEEKTWKAIRQHVDTLLLCPPSRLRDEILKDLYSGASAEWFKLALDSGIFSTLFPLYQEVLTQDSSSKTQIADLLTAMDRANSYAVANHIHRQPDYFLFSLFFIPWAEYHHKLFSQPRRGQELFQIGKQIRRTLDETIGIQLNLRRSLRQEMVSLLINLSQLIFQKNSKGDWPTRLKKKSYFKKTELFYTFYIEATSGEPRVVENLAKATSPPKVKEFKKGASRGGCRPAYAPNTPGGVFGLKK